MIEQFDITVEQALLGAMISNNALIDAVAADFSSNHLYDPLHRRMLDTIIHLRGLGSVTPLTLKVAMSDDPGLKEIGGHRYLADLVQSSPSLPNVADLIRILLDLSMRRDLIMIGEDTIAAAQTSSRENPSRAIADTITGRLLQLGRATARKITTAYQIALQSLQEVERIATQRVAPLIKTGIKPLDDEIGGLRGGELIVIGGKSGMGKSALMGGIARNTAFGGVPTIVFSIEMTQRQWVERMVCDIDFDTAEKPMWYQRVRNGRLSSEEFTRFGEAMQKLDGIPFQIHDDEDLTIEAISAFARAFAARYQGQQGVIFIDYLQRVEITDQRAQREQQVAHIARGAKSLAKRLDWPVVIGSQMNEDDQARSKDERRPQLRDARESRVIGNEADLFLSPFRLAYFVENKKPMEALPGDSAWLAWRSEMKACEHRMDLLMLKNRHGRRVDFELYCDMGASAIRADAPYRARTPEEGHVADLLANA